MRTLIKNELRQSRRTLLIWMGMVLLLCGFAFLEYLSLQESIDDLMELVNGFPEILKIMFGTTGDLTTALGWYGCIYFWASILNCAYAGYLGITCVAGEKERGTAEYLFTKPFSRNQIVVAKAVSGGCDLLILAAFSGLCNYFTAILPLGGLAQRGAVLTTTIGLFLTELTLFSITLLVSGLTKTYKGAVRTGTGLLLLFYGISITAEYLEIPALYYLTPIKYFDVYTVAAGENGVSFFLLSMVIVVGSVAAAQKAWTCREI